MGSSRSVQDQTRPGGVTSVEMSEHADETGEELTLVMSEPIIDQDELNT